MSEEMNYVVDVEQAFTKKIAFFDEVRIIVNSTRVDDCSIL